MNKKKATTASNLKQTPVKNTTQSKAAKNTDSPLKQQKPIEFSAFDKLWDKFINGYGVWIASVLGLVLVLYVFNDFIFGDLTMLYKDIGSDTITSFYPGTLAYEQMVKNYGMIPPTWSFTYGLGQSYYSGYDFINLVTLLNLFVYSLVKSGDIAASIAWLQACYFVGVVVVSYAYFRIMAIDKYTSILATIIITLFGIMTLGSGWYSYTFAVLQFVFFLYAFELFYQKNIWIVFPYAAYFAGGLSPQLFFFAEFLVVYFLMRSINDHGWKPMRFVISGLKLVGLSIFGILLSSSGLLSRYYSTIDMPRFYGNSSSYVAKLSDISMFSLENNQFDFNIPFHHYKTAILRLFSNDIMGIGSDFKGWYNYLEAPIFYCGILTLLLLPQIFSFVNKKTKIVLGGFLGFWLFLIIFPYFRHAFHLFVGDYYKVSISMFFPFSMVLVAVFGFTKIATGEKSINTKLLIGTFIALFVFLFFPYYPTEYNIINKDVRASVPGYLILYAILLYLFKFKKHTAFLKIALLLVVCVEMSSFAIRTMTQRPVISKAELNQKVGFNDFTVDAVKQIKANDKSFFRLEKEYQSSVAIHSSLNDGQAQGFYGTSCYSSSNQINYIRFLEETRVTGRGNESQSRWAPGLKSRPLLMTTTNVKYLLTKSDSSQSRSYGYKKIGKVGDVSIMKNEFYLPLGVTYDKYISKADFDKLSNFQCDLTLLRACVIDSADLNSELTKDLGLISAKDSLLGLTFPLYRQLVDSLKADSLQMSLFTMDKIEGTLNLNKKKIIYISTSFDRGWTASIDGKPTKVYRVNLGLIGLAVEKGKHEIKLKYVPTFSKESLMIQYLIYFIYASLICWFLVGRFKKRASLLNK